MSIHGAKLLVNYWQAIAILRKIAYLAEIPFPEFLLMLVGDISPNP